MRVGSASVPLDRFATFGDLLRFLRRRAGFTQRELSIAVGYSDPQISRLEQNLRLPDLPTIAARFVPALHLEDEPEAVQRLLDLAAAVRREDAPAAGLSPFKGLLCFEEADAEWFFGREALVEVLVARLTGAPAGPRFLAVIGASGSGKSSVVRAGVIPALRWNPATSGWRLQVLTPSAHPLRALAASLDGERRPASATTALADELARDPHSLQRHLRAANSGAAADCLLLVVDQFEELFTLCADERERQIFIDQLLAAAGDPQGPATVLITLRADFYAHCAGFPDLREVLAGHQVYIGGLSADELRQAIEAPAQRGGWELEAGLADLLLKEVGAEGGRAPEPGALPLLSHALHATWQRRRGRKLTLSGYAASGGVHGAIAETAEAVFHDQLSADQRLVARRIFLRLTQLGEDDARVDTRRRVALEELASGAAEGAVVRQTLTLLADARLVTTQAEAIEVAHEALIREWPTLRGWIAEDREGLRLHRRLTEAALDWERTGRDEALTYRGARLVQALEWASANAAELNTLEHAFLSASQGLAEHAAAEREAQRQRELEAARRLAEAEQQRAEQQTRTAAQLRRRAVFLAGAFVLALIMAGAALFFGEQARESAVTAQEQQRLAFGRELSAAAIASLETDPDRGLLLALEAVSVTRASGLEVPFETEDALHRAVQATRVERVLRGHQDAVWGVAFSPDGAQVATASWDHTVRVWDAATGQVAHVLSGHAGVVYSVAYRPDGQQLATAGDDRIVILWDAAAGQAERTLAGHAASVSNVVYSPDGRFLATASEDWTARMWETATGQELRLFYHPRGVTEVAFSPDGTRLATAGSDGTTRIWDAATGAELHVLRGHLGAVRGVAFSPDGRLLATASEDRMVRVWEAATGVEVRAPLGHSDRVIAIAFSPDGSQLATAGRDGRVYFWDVASWSRTLTLAGHSGMILGLAFSPDGRRLVSGGVDGTARLWNVSLSREWWSAPLVGNSVAVAFRPDGQWVAASGADGVSVWDAATGAEVPAARLRQSDVSAVAFSPDGQRLATGDRDFTVGIWEAATGQRLQTLTGPDNFVIDVAFSPDGTRLAAASVDRSVTVWDLASGRREHTFVASNAAQGVAFSPEGGGRRLAAGTADGWAEIWDLGSDAEPQRLQHGAAVQDVAFSPDGARLAAAGWDGTATVWDAATGELLLRLAGHTGCLVTVAFSPDGARLATSSLDGTVKIWDAATGQEQASLAGDARGVFAAAFSPQDGGARLAAVGGDGIHMYALRLEDLVTLAQARAPRALTQAECLRYLHRDEAACAALAPVEAGPVQAAASEGRLCQVLEIGGMDDIFNRMVAAAIRPVAERFGWEVEARDSVDAVGYSQRVEQFRAADCDLILGVFSDMGEAIRGGAVAEPSQKFFVVDAVYDPPLDNVWASVYATDQAAFLAGYAAASVTASGKVGTFGGIDFAPVTNFMDGFALGVAYYNQQNGAEVQVLGWDPAAHEGLFAGTFAGSDNGGRLATQLMDQGADIIMPVAGSEQGWGALQAVAQRPGVYYIGVDFDWAFFAAPQQAGVVLTSVEKRLDASAAEAAQAVIAGTFTGGIHVGTLANGGVALSPFHALDGLISDRVKADLEVIRAGIIAGEIKTRP